MLAARSFRLISGRQSAIFSRLATTQILGESAGNLNKWGRAVGEGDPIGFSATEARGGQEETTLSLSLRAWLLIFPLSSLLCHFPKKAEFGRGGILVVRMIEPLLTSCQKGPFSLVRLVGSGSGNSHAPRLRFSVRLAWANTDVAVAEERGNGENSRKGFCGNSRQTHFAVMAVPEWRR